MTLTEAQTTAYLDRLGIRPADVSLDVEGLARLQHAHLTAVPFTNLDVYDGLPVSTDLAWSVEAVVQGRGGWCFVLNGAFAALLDSLGFEVTRWAALVVMTANISPMDDHLCLRVELERPYLVDVGFGDSFTRPLALDTAEAQDDPGAGRRFRVATSAGDHRRSLQSERVDDAGALTWRTDYLIDEHPRTLAHFTPANDYLATTPGLLWTDKRFVTRLSAEGRLTLLEDRVTQPVDGQPTTTSVDPGDWDAVHRRLFPSAG